MPDFGLSELLLPAIGGEAGLFGAAAPEVAGIGAGALEGGALGAATSPIMGTDPGQGALFGALGGGAVGGAGAAGLGTAGQAAAGAATGAISSGAQGGDPLTGAFTGAAQGAGAGLFGSGSGSSAVGAAGGAAGTGTPVDLTAGVGAFGGEGGGVGGFGGGTGPFGDFGGGGATGAGTGAGVTGTGTATGTGVSAGVDAGANGFANGSDWGNFQDASGGKSGSGGWFDKQLSRITDHPEMLMMAAPLAMNLLGGGSSSDASMKALAQQAAETGSQAKTNMAYMQSGTLPAGLQDTLRGATNAAKASVRSRYAQMGLAGSTMEGQALQQIDQTSASQSAQIAMQLFQQGVGLNEIESSIYSKLLTAQMAQDKQFSDALSSFARGMSGGGTGSGKWSLTQD